MTGRLLRGSRRAPGSRLLVLAGLALVLAACDPVMDRVTYPPAGATTGPIGADAAATRQTVIAALGAVGIGVSDAQHPYRPPEGARFTAAARIVLQASLPNDPDHGFFVIYQLASSADALAAAEEQAAYVVSGPGKIQFASDTRFVIRVVGPTAIFLAWSPSASPEKEAQALADALARIGTGIAVPG